MTGIAATETFPETPGMSLSGRDSPLPGATATGIQQDIERRVTDRKFSFRIR